MLDGLVREHGSIEAAEQWQQAEEHRRLEEQLAKNRAHAEAAMASARQAMLDNETKAVLAAAEAFLREGDDGDLWQLRVGPPHEGQSEDERDGAQDDEAERAIDLATPASPDATGREGPDREGGNGSITEKYSSGTPGTRNATAM